MKAEKSLTHLIEEGQEQMNWLVKEIVIQNRSQREILIKIMQLSHQYKNNLILLKDIPDRLEGLVDEIGELNK